MLLFGFVGMASQVVDAGAIRYPALGHLELEEGTIELWVTPMAELYPEIEGFRRGFSLFSLDVPGHFSFSGMWATSDDAHGPHVSMSSQRQERGLTPVPGRAVDWWQKGEPAHVALTWKGREMTLVVDGDPVGQRRQGVAFSGDLARVMLVIGDARSRDNEVVLHAVRVSNVARPPESFAESEPTADVFTLLLDRFQRVERDDDGAWSIPEVARLGSEADSIARGEIRGSWRRVERPKQGLALYPAP